ncbi:hypothetical protein ACFU5P_10210 [Streptomyces sp. NPDC057433]|uniref:hypothetical protein n=1 Tax=Streptomyces sp. NPDC057433 TaxID=3346132 RepID=UPI0036C49D9B
MVPGRRAYRINSAANPTFGAYGHLLKDPDNWAALGWAIDQEHFLTALEECHRFRNSLMHFSPDPVTDGRLLSAQGLLELLRSMDPQSRGPGPEVEAMPPPHGAATRRRPTGALAGTGLRATPSPRASTDSAVPG